MAERKRLDGALKPQALPPTDAAVGDSYLDDGSNTGSGNPGWRYLVSTGPDVWADSGGAGGAGMFEEDAVENVIQPIVAQIGRGFIVGSQSMDDSGAVNDSRMFFNKAKGAFRAGRATSSDWDDVNVGNYSIALGDNSTAPGNQSFALTLGNASGSASVSLGGGEASGYSSLAKGWATEASGSYASAIGHGKNTVPGDMLEASGTGSHAEGYWTLAIGDHSHAEGYNTESIGDHSHAEGYGQDHTGLFDKQEATGFAAHVEGAQNVAGPGIAAHAEGRYTQAIGNHSHTEGTRTKATGVCSHAEGGAVGANYTTASGDYSHAEGYETTASGARSHAEGFRTQATNTDAHAEGDLSVASGVSSHAEGLDHSGNPTTASGLGSHAEGQGTLATGSNSHTEGKGTEATNLEAHAEGRYTRAEGVCDHAEGYRSVANGATSGFYYQGGTHAEGNDTEATGIYGAHAEGMNTIASGSRGSHAEGQDTRAYGTSSHAEGVDTAASNYAHAEGDGTTAPGRASHAEGISSYSYFLGSHASSSGRISNAVRTQYLRVVLGYRLTADVLWHPLTFAGSAPASSTSLIVPSNTSWAVDIEVTARDAPIAGGGLETGDTATFFFKSAIKSISTVAATGILTFIGIPLNGEIVTIDGVVYTFQTTLTFGAGNVLIGINPDVCLDNLIAAITLGPGQGTLYGWGTAQHPTVTASAGAGFIMDTTAKVKGVDGNSITTTTGVTGGSWANPTLTGGAGVRSFVGGVSPWPWSQSFKDAVSWDCRLVIGTTVADALEIECLGDATRRTIWEATVHITEVTV